MVNLILDTDIWIGFIVQNNPKNILETLIQKKNSNEIILLTNKIVIEEWKRNRENTLKTGKKLLIELLRTSNQVTEYLSETDKKTFKEILQRLSSNESKMLTAVENQIAKTEELLMSCEVTPITDEMKLQVTDWALNKRAPFLNDKNSVADSLILLSAVTFCKAKTVGITDSIFVSFNHKDFSSTADKNLIHEDLSELLENANMTFTRNIGEALNLAPKLIQEIDSYIEYQVDRWIESEIEIARGK